MFFIKIKGKFKQTLVAAVCFSLLSATASAAPQFDLKKGEFSTGVNYWNADMSFLAVDGLKHSDDGNLTVFYLEGGLSDKFSLGISHTTGDEQLVYPWDNTTHIHYLNTDISSTDVWLRYNVDTNGYIIVGHRNFSNDWTDDCGTPGDLYDQGKSEINTTFYGVGGKVALDKKLTGYAQLIAGEDMRDYEFGTIYDLGKSSALDLGYKYSKMDDLENNGFYFGLNYKF